MLSLRVQVCYKTLRHWGVAARAFVAGSASTHLALAMAQATERIGETFGIGLLHPGRAEEAVPRFVSRPARRHSCGSFPCLECGGGPRGDRRQDANPVPDARSTISAPGADHLRNPLCHARKPSRRRSRSLLSGPWMRWILGISFLSVAGWALLPDKYEGDDRGISRGRIPVNAQRFFPRRDW
jgi:hypothetical protein